MKRRAVIRIDREQIAGLLDLPDGLTVRCVDTLHDPGAIAIYIEGTHRPEPGIGCTRPGCLCLEPREVASS
jgi:hypothetical protein